MTLTEITRYANIKGLQLVGTGDFTHPQWLKEIQDTLVADGDSGLLRLRENTSLQPVHFMLTAEVCTIYDWAGKNRKVHHVVLAPDLDCVVQINEKLGKRGDLASDGRPIFGITSPQLVEEIKQVSPEVEVFPAHVWTPWFGVFGAFSGFDIIQDCYQDMTKHIHALETGLSSNPQMNWRLSDLDRFTLVSNSDCHSFWPWRLGREANVFELERATYREVTDAIKTKDTERFKFTIETDPAYGKYHWTGHRNCNVSLSPSEARKHNNICPVCGRKLTEGVEQRVEELADRPSDFKATGSPGFVCLMPLHEIIAAVVEAASPSTQAVWKIYTPLINKFGNEFAVLIDASREAITEIAGSNVAEAIVKVREGNVTVVPGYDGVYGRLVLSRVEKRPSLPAKLAQFPPVRIKPPHGRVQQSSLGDFI